MAKLDKIKFARLIGFLERVHALNLKQDDVEFIDEIIDIDQPEQGRVYPCNDAVNELMRLMVEGQRKIEAIKVHRAITGFGLKESKDAVEKYWPVERKDAWTKEQLLAKLSNPPLQQLDTAIIEGFIKSL